MRLLPTKPKSLSQLLATQLTPPRRLNWNVGNAKGDYVERFTANFIRYYFPYLLRNARQLGVPSDSVKLLDIGCGWGPMAIPVVLYKLASAGTHQIDYLGIDIRKDAIDWLAKAYSAYPFVKFQLHDSIADIDYIKSEHSKIATVASSDGQEGEYKIPRDFAHTIQWSSSVFTHLTPEACLSALKAIRSSCAELAFQINTWLIIDDESRFALAAETADRKLPYDCGSFLTYSEANPLVCTAYKIEAVISLYDEAGLEIVNVERGSWRGPAYKNDANHYQDIVISKPRRSRSPHG